MNEDPNTYLHQPNTSSIESQTKHKATLAHDNRFVEPRNSLPGCSRTSMGQVNQGRKTSSRVVSSYMPLDAPTLEKPPLRQTTREKKQAASRQKKPEVSSEGDYMPLNQSTWEMPSASSRERQKSPSEGTYMSLSEAKMESSTGDYMAVHRAIKENEYAVPHIGHAQNVDGQGQYMPLSEFTRDKPVDQQATDGYGGTGNYMPLQKMLEDSLSSTASGNETRKPSGETIYMNLLDSTGKKP